jgi:hypothetical protein
MLPWYDYRLKQPPHLMVMIFITKKNTRIYHQFQQNAYGRDKAMENSWKQPTSAVLPSQRLELGSLDV